MTMLPYRPRDASCAEPPLRTAILIDLAADEAPAGLIGAARHVLWLLASTGQRHVPKGMASQRSCQISRPAPWP